MSKKTAIPRLFKSLAVESVQRNQEHTSAIMERWLLVILYNLVPHYRSCIRATRNLCETHTAKGGSNARENERVRRSFAQRVFWVSLHDCPTVLPDILYGIFEELACDPRVSEFSGHEKTND